MAPNGDLYIADYVNYRVRKVSWPISGVSSANRLLASEDGAEVYVMDGVGRHLSTRNALTGAIRYTFGYDAQGLLNRLTDGDGNVTAIERDGLGNPTAMVAPFGQRTTLSADGNGSLARVTNPAGESSQMTYTGDGLLTGFTDPKGQVATFAYNAEGRLLKDQDAAGGFIALARTSVPNGYQVALSTALGQQTTYRVENLADGQRRRFNTFPDSTSADTRIGTDGSTRTTWSDGAVVDRLEGPDPRFGMQAPLGKTLKQSSGGLTATLTSARSVTLADPSDLLSLTTLTDTRTLNGRISTSVYQANTRTTTATTAAGRQSHMLIDTQGRPIHDQPTGLFTTDYAYDVHGRLQTVTQGDNTDMRSLTLGYNPEGYVQSITDPLNQTTGFTYDLAGRPLRQTFPDGREVHYVYDPNGNLTALTPPGRPSHTFDYTGTNLLARYAPPDAGDAGKDTVYHYNLERHLTEIIRPDGLTLRFDYDAAGRLSQATLPNTTRTYAYAATTGHLATITTAGGGILRFGYNGALLTQAAWEGGDVQGRVSYAYDNDFRLASLQVNNQPAIGFAYDADSLLTQAGTLSLTYRPDNGLLSGTALGDVKESYSYNGFGERTDYQASYQTTPVLGAHYAYDKLGRITRKDETLAASTTVYEYGYDLAGRLSAVTVNGNVTARYTYDDNGNRLSGPGLSAPPSYDVQDRLLAYGDATYAYTANGELLSKTQGGQQTQYHYDVLGHLRHADLPDGRKIDYLVDGQNRWIGKKLTDTNGNTTSSGYLYQNRLRPVAELDGNNQVVAVFVHATHANVPDYLIKGGATYRILTDHLGSPRLVVNIANGSVVQRLDYDEFGQVILDTNPGFQPFGFAGGLYDPETGLVRFGGRDYDAATARWTAKDPIIFSGGQVNLYVYTNNNPINLIDPEGNVPKWFDDWIKRNSRPDVQRDLKNAVQPQEPPPVSTPRPPPGSPKLSSPSKFDINCEKDLWRYFDKNTGKRLRSSRGAPGVGGWLLLSEGIEKMIENLNDKYNPVYSPIKGLGPIEELMGNVSLEESRFHRQGYDVLW